TLEELANRMLDARKTIAIDMNGPRIESKSKGPFDWSALTTVEKNALIILFATLRAQNGVLLIDEVDASLHHLNRDLTKNMRALNPGGQFILTTRSLRIMDYVGKGFRFWFGEDGVIRSG
ncbi:MAG: ATP-binding protein, partial [Proteobacteria bacterium]|nr:ATP-binding protein [Pseudomonadota bacterium]